VNQRRPAAEPQDPGARRGRDVFLAGSCARCHAIAGTQAQGSIGPDLTHLASRQTIAAGMFPNNRGHLAGWIGDPQALKPGVNMPANPLPPDDLQALLAYLETLR
jgi:cytochrome c oxidase subunit 2